MYMQTILYFNINDTLEKTLKFILETLLELS